MKAADRLEVRPGIWLDGRRAIWFAQEKVLAVADLHLGYTWAQRQAGQLLPLSAPDDTLDRLLDLARSYAPQEIVLLGDILHRVLDLPGLCGEVDTLLSALRSVSRLRLVTGNHDRNLAQLAAKVRLVEPLESCVQVAGHRLVHGDAHFNKEAGQVWTVMGHEHPALWLGDGVRAAKCPCFLVGPSLVVLPAFSTWAAGTPIESGFMSPLARGETFTRAIAIMGSRLLPVPLSRRRAMD